MHTNVQVPGTVRSDTGKPIDNSMDRKRTTRLVLISLLLIGVPWGVWSVSALLSGGRLESVAIIAMMGCFALLAIGYLGLYDPRGAAWFSVPVLITFSAFWGFILIPAWLFTAGNELADPAYVRAIFLTWIGFAAFWGGSLAFMKGTRFQFVPRLQSRSQRVAFMSVILLVLGSGTRLVLWKAGLYSYAADAEVLASSFAFVQWLSYLGNLLDAALLVSAIEIFGNRSKEPIIRIVFWISLISSIGFGLISGMKGTIAVPLLILLIAYSITNAKIPRVVWLLPILPVMIYPFSDAYRNNLNNGYRSQVNTIEGQWSVIVKSYEDIISSQSTGPEVAKEGFNRTASRSSLLSCVRDVVNLPDPSVLYGKGDLRIWQAPFYSLVPRFLWKNKPVLNFGLRLTVARGRPATSWSSATPIGDLYSLYGPYGVVVVMFIYGICMQLYMNRVVHKVFSEREVFVYISMLMPLVGLGLDVASYVAGAVQLWIWTLAMSYIIYGRPTPFLQVVRD